MDASQLLSPLATPFGACGEDMVFSAQFDAIQEARRFDDPSLSQGEWVTDIKEADWPTVIRLCEALLATQSKDLRIAAWLAEAYCRNEGLSGLARGYELLDGLANEFWDDIHPQPEDGDQEQRAGLFDWLCQQTHRLIRSTPITQSAKGAYALIDLESARHAAHIGEAAHDQAVAQPTLSMAQFEAAARDTPASFFSREQAALERLISAMQSLQLLLDSQMGDQSPSFGPCFDALDDLQRFFRRHASPRTEEIQGTSAAPAASVTTASSHRPAPTSLAAAVPSGPIQSREHAIQQLQEIAAFFRRTEPHSPVAYLADKAAQWGNMSLHEWLRTVVKDDSALLRVEELLGVEARPPGEFS